MCFLLWPILYLSCPGGRMEVKQICSFGGGGNQKLSIKELFLVYQVAPWKTPMKYGSGNRQLLADPHFTAKCSVTAGAKLSLRARVNINVICNSPNYMSQTLPIWHRTFPCSYYLRLRPWLVQLGITYRGPGGSLTPIIVDVNTHRRWSYELIHSLISSHFLFIQPCSSDPPLHPSQHPFVPSFPFIR